MHLSKLLGTGGQQMDKTGYDMHQEKSCSPADGQGGGFWEAVVAKVVHEAV